MQELKTSIEDNRLMHAPVLRKEGGGMVLVAGERRLLAIKEIFELGGGFIYDNVPFAADDGMIPYTDLGDLDELAAEEAELDENLRRMDLTWKELAAAHDRLHKLRTRQRDKENADKPVAEQKPAHTVADTAQELTGRRDGSYHDGIRKELIVAQHLTNPEVAKAKNVDEAFKILKRQEDVAKNVELARTVGATFNADLHTLLHDNCLLKMAGWAAAKSELFDVILTDPPYGMGADTFGDSGGRLVISHQYDDSYESWQVLMREWVRLAYAVTKPLAHAYVFCDIDRFHELRGIMGAAGWDVFRTPFIVHKMNSGRVPRPDCGPRRQYEILLYALKGGKPVTHIYPDVISVSGDENLGHGAQKPVALYQNLLQRSVRPGDRVLDPFCGSGTIFEACNEFKCSAVGIEMEASSYGIALKRLQMLKKLETPSLF